MTAIINQPAINSSPYLRTSRQWPTDIGNLVVELNTSYNEVSTNLNLRTIGIFPTTRNAITGESWYLNSSNKQQSIRQVFTFAGPISTTTTTIPHNVPPNSYTNFLPIQANFFDGTNWQNLPYVSVTNVNNQIRISVDATNIIITRGSGSPVMNNVLIVLSWLSNV